MTHFQKPRTWHIVFADSYSCDLDRPIATLGEQPNYVEFTFTMLNPDYFNNATDHFSDEESGTEYLCILVQRTCKHHFFEQTIIVF